MFGGIWFFEKYPYALPNIVASLFGFSAAVISSIYLKEVSSLTPSATSPPYFFTDISFPQNRRSHLRKTMATNPPNLPCQHGNSSTNPVWHLLFSSGVSSPSKASPTPPSSPFSGSLPSPSAATASPPSKSLSSSASEESPKPSGYYSSSPRLNAAGAPEASSDIAATFSPSAVSRIPYCSIWCANTSSRILGFWACCLVSWCLDPRLLWRSLVSSWLSTISRLSLLCWGR